MPKSKIILAFGFLIALLPILGFPHSWESFFQILFGLSIVLLSVLISIDRRLSLKARVQKRQARKRAVVDSNPEVQFGRRASDLAAAPLVRVGRRATDPVVPVQPDEEDALQA
jgi:hypothetical protein